MSLYRIRVPSPIGALHVVAGDSALAGLYMEQHPQGAANGRNPISVIVPCHRVIGARGALTGYAGGIARKQWLLRHERALPGLTAASAAL